MENKMNKPSTRQKTTGADALKRAAVLILTICLLLAAPSALAGGAGTASDPLVTRSYITDTYIPAQVQAGKTAAAEAAAKQKDAELSRLAAAADDASISLGIAPDGSFLSRGSAPVSLTSGGAMTALSGACITAVSGSVKASIATGAVVDVTTGAEIASGTALAAGHKYLCCEDTRVSLTASGAAYVMADGYVSLGSGAELGSKWCITPRQAYIVPSPQTIRFNGRSLTLEVYNIDGNNYFKLRDMAALMTDTASRFEVGFSTDTFRVQATKGAYYTAVGGELESGEDHSASCVPSRWAVYVDGLYMPVYAYNIDGSNFFKLRDLGKALGFFVDYEESTNTAIIESSEYHG